jgi:hypothetical protein
MNDDTRYPVDFEHHYPVEPLYLEFRDYGCLGDSHRLLWDPASETLQLIRNEFGEQEARTLTTPTRAQWKAFWILLEKAQAWHWPEEFHDEIGIIDGGGWSLEVSYAGRRIKSGGVNAYPDARGTDYLPGSQFDVLCTAILMLTNGEFPGLID